MRRSAALGFVAALTLTAAVPAFADGSADSAEARAAALYDRGADAHDAGRYAEAAQSFADADALAPNDVTLETALREALRADLPVLGMRLHARASRVAAPSAGLREAVSSVAAAFAERVGYVRLACDDCRARLAEVELGTSTELALEPGQHRVVFDQGEVTIDLEAGEHLSVSPPSTVEPPPPEVPGAVEVHPAWLTIGVVATLALGAASVGSYVQARALEDELAILRAAHIEAGSRDISAAGQNAETRLYAFTTLTFVSAFVTTAIAIWAVDWDGEPSATVSIGPGSVGLHAAF